MEKNRLKIIHADAFISLPNLRIAKFGQNYLNLTTGIYNHVGQVSPFYQCSYVEELYLSHNHVSEIFKDWIVNHTLLRNLDLSYNNFTYLETNDLRFNSNNLKVDLTNNFMKIVNLTQLDKIPKKLNSSRNVVVDLNYNPIDCYCEVVSLYSYVKEHLSETIKREDLDYVKLLTSALYCNVPLEYRGKRGSDIHGKLTCSVENGRSRSCASIEGCDCHIWPGSNGNWLWLHCQERNLKVAPTWIIGWNIDDAYLNFSGNALQSAPDVTKGGYEYAGRSTLNLSRNKINSLQKHSVKATYILDLYLDHNNFTKIDMEVVRYMATMRTYLKIAENPWPCNQETLEFRNYVRDYVNKITDRWILFSYDWDMDKLTCNNTQESNQQITTV